MGCTSVGGTPDEARLYATTGPTPVPDPPPEPPPEPPPAALEAAETS